MKDREKLLKYIRDFITYDDKHRNTVEYDLEETLEDLVLRIEHLMEYKKPTCCEEWRKIKSPLKFDKGDIVTINNLDIKFCPVCGEEL